MRIAEIEIDPSQYASVNFSQDQHIRSAGVHLSQIIALMQDVMSGRDKPDLGNEQLEAYRMFGFLFERVLFDVLLQDRLIERPGEFTSQEGVIMTPDAIDVQLFSGIEAKATWRSMPDTVEDMHYALTSPELFAHWLWQIQSYCRIMGLSTYQLWTFWVNGNYRDLRGPKLRKFDLEFSKPELEKSWDMITRFGRKRGLIK